MEKNYIAPEVLQGKFTTKKSMYKVLAIGCKFCLSHQALGQVFLPSNSKCLLHFIMQLIAREKFVSNLQHYFNIGYNKSRSNQIVVSKYQELSTSKVWGFVKECENLIHFLPDFDDQQISERRFSLEYCLQRRDLLLKILLWMQEITKH